ncbi:MAG: 4Fe-4S dicluster domain-containing protein [Pseudomonadota bacterium]
MPSAIVKRPRRWDQPFGESMSREELGRVLSAPHFAQMDEDNFPAHTSLAGLIQNDCRLRQFSANELIVSAGEYLNSAFLVLSGQVLLVRGASADQQADNSITAPAYGFWQALAKEFNRSTYPETREIISARGTRQNRQETNRVKSRQVDIESLLEVKGSDAIELHTGDLFGEAAVLGRNELLSSVVAINTVEVLEIRWQGLREFRKYEPAFKAFVDDLYRQRGLYEHLLTLPLLRHIDRTKIKQLAEIALFEVHGNFAWQKNFNSLNRRIDEDNYYNELIESEPRIAGEGDYPDGVLLLRNGFARISRKINHGHYTLGHLGAGGVFGLREVYSAWQQGKSQALPCSLSALGYTDVIRIPSQWLEQHVFSDSENRLLQQALQTALDDSQQGGQLQDAGVSVDRKLIEFTVENRYINGSKTMMIDLERCTRCDDCVTACANAHDNNPRFLRHGPKFGQYMVANACMHCEDPVCMIGCPTGAIHRSANGIVQINDQTCVGCSSCANNCPYENIRMVPVRDQQNQLYVDDKAQPILKATKCDLCIGSSAQPACERACPQDALTRIDLKDLVSLAEWVGR